MIPALYFLVGIGLALWAGGAFDDRSQWLVVAPIVALFWPIFVVVIAMTWLYFEAEQTIRRWNR